MTAYNTISRTLTSTVVTTFSIVALNICLIHNFLLLADSVGFEPTHAVAPN